MKLSKGDYLIVDPSEIYYNKIDWASLSQHDKFLAIELDGVVHAPFHSPIFTIRSGQKPATWQVVDGINNFEVVTRSGFLSIIPIEDLYLTYVDISLFDDNKLVVTHFDEDIDVQTIRAQRFVANSILVYERN